MEKTRQKEERYEECDFCGKEIYTDDLAYRIQGDFPTVAVHEERCHRQAVANGINSIKTAPSSPLYERRTK